MTCSSSHFEIRGSGCLESIEYQANKPIVKIRCTFSPGEEVIFICKIDFGMKIHLSKYEDFLQYKKTKLMVSFALRYQETLDFFYCRTKEDPDRIVTITAELLKLKVCS